MQKVTTTITITISSCLYVDRLFCIVTPLDTLVSVLCPAGATTACNSSMAVPAKTDCRCDPKAITNDCAAGWACAACYATLLAFALALTFTLIFTFIFFINPTITLTCTLPHPCLRPPPYILTCAHINTCTFSFALVAT